MVYDVFLSYRRSDGLAMAEMLYRFLTAKGLRVFFDKEEMDTGYFDDQIRDQVIGTPNYLFLGTADAFCFRKNVFDYVQEEIRLALREYDRDPGNRVVLPILPKGVDFPRQEDMPAGCERIARHDAILLKGGLPDEKELDKILRRVTKVTRRNLWQAGHRWLSNKRLPGGRFQLLAIDETLFSPVKKIGEDLAYSARDKWGMETEDRRSTLTEVLAETRQHIYLAGEGGIGKTTTLIHIMERIYGEGTYDPRSQVPLFIELSRAPDLFGRLYEGGISTFIRRAIYQQLREDRSARQVSSREIGGLEEAFMADPQMAVIPINDLFARESPAPEYLLLLDGLNEVSRVEIPETGKMVVQMILDEIEWLMTACPNVRVILTGRSSEVRFAAENLQGYECCGLRDEDILRYLRGRETIAGEAGAPPTMMKILRVPLFLTLYAAVGPAAQLSSRGEILHAFFHAGGEELPAYSARARIAEVDRDVSSASRVRQERRITSEMQYFLLDFLLPEIGWEMESRQQYFLRLGGKSGIRALMERVLTGTEDTDFCGEYGCEVFTQRGQGSRKRSIRRTARDILACLGEDPMEVAETLADCAVMSLGVLREAGNGSYEFAHEHFRDYFAAVRETHSLMLARRLYEEGEPEPAGECLESWRRAPLGRQVRRLIGEILGEHHNVPVYDGRGKWQASLPEGEEPRALLRRTLDLFRGRFDGEDGYAVFNILSILKEVRKDLSGEDFSRLDLTGCELNGAVLGENGCRTNFDGARVQDSVFLPRGHVDYILSACYTPDSTRILTASRDGAVRIWDAATFAEIGILHQEAEMVLDAVCSPGGERIAVLRKHFVDLYRTDSREHIAGAEFPEDTLLACVWHPDGRRFALGDASGNIRICDADSLAEEREIRICGEMGHPVDISMDFYPDGRLITAGGDGLVRVFDIDTGEMIREWEMKGPIPSMKESVRYVEVSPDGARLLLIDGYGNLQLWDGEMTEQKDILGDLFQTFRAAHFRADGRQVISEEGGTICLWDAESGEPLAAGISSDRYLAQVMFSPNGKQILALMGDNYVTVYDAVTWEVIGVMGSPTLRLESVTFCDDSRQIITAANDGTIRLWDAATGKMRMTFPERCSGFETASLSPDGNRYCAAEESGCLRMYDRRTGALLAQSEALEWSTRQLYWHPDGTEVASTNIDGVFRIYDAEDLTLRDEWMEEKRESGRDVDYYSADVCSAAYSPDGTLLLTGTTGGEVWIRDARTHAVLGRIVKAARGYRDVAGPHVSHIAFPSDDKIFLTRGLNSAIRLWDARSGEAIGSLKGSLKTWLAAYAPDGRTIAGVSGDNMIEFWNVHTMRKIRGGIISGGRICTLEYRSDGRVLLIASIDDTIRLLDAETLACLRVIRYVPGLDVMGCDLRRRDPGSRLSEEMRETLTAYGALV